MNCVGFGYRQGMPDERAIIPIQTLLVVAVDGSHNAVRAGFGFYSSENLFGFGPCDVSEPAEFVAVIRALDAVPVNRPVLFLSDSEEVGLRLGDGVPPRVRNANRDMILAAMERVATRPVTFERVRQDVEVVPLHAVAHYLSFLGRQGLAGAPGVRVSNVDAILDAPDANRFAHHLVHQHLFPPR